MTLPGQVRSFKCSQEIKAGDMLTIGDNGEVRKADPDNAPVGYCLRNNPDGTITAMLIIQRDVSKE
jgi:hypothetical protein